MEWFAGPDSELVARRLRCGLVPIFIAACEMVQSMLQVESGQLGAVLRGVDHRRDRRNKWNSRVSRNALQFPSS